MRGESDRLSPTGVDSRVSTRGLSNTCFGARSNKSVVLGERSVWKGRVKRRVLTIRLTSKRCVWSAPDMNVMEHGP